VSLSSLSTAIDALVVAAGFVVAQTKDVSKIPAHRATKDLVVDVSSVESMRGASGRLERYRLTIAGIWPESMRVDAGARTALTAMETIRDALAGASALAIVPARVIAVDMSQESTGTGAILVSVVADIQSSR